MHKHIDITPAHVTVLANCFTQDAADQLRRDCSDRVRTFVFDVTNVDAIRAAYREIEQLVDDNGVLHENIAYTEVYNPFLM